MPEASGKDEVPAPALQLAGKGLRGGEDAGQEDLLGGPRVLPPDSSQRRGEHPFEAWLLKVLGKNQLVYSGAKGQHIYMYRCDKCENSSYNGTNIQSTNAQTYILKHGFIFESEMVNHISWSDVHLCLIHVSSVHLSLIYPIETPDQGNFC